MNKFITFIMYFLWTLTIVAVLAATFTSFKYWDLNGIALALLVFSGINSYFVTKKH